jgi:hypothetical protein
MGAGAFELSLRGRRKKEKKRTIVFLRKQSQLRIIYFQLYSELKNTIYEASLLLFHKNCKNMYFTKLS